MTPRNKAALIGLKNIILSRTTTALRVVIPTVSLFLGTFAALISLFTLGEAIGRLAHGESSPSDHLLFFSYLLFSGSFFIGSWSMGEWNPKFSNIFDRVLEKVCDGSIMFAQKHGSLTIPCEGISQVHKTAVFFFLLCLAVPFLLFLLVLYGLSFPLRDVWRFKEKFFASLDFVAVIDKLASHAPGQVAKEESRQLFEKHSVSVPTRGRQTL